MIKIVLIVVALIAAFILWRWTSMARGANQRDEKVLGRIDHIGRRLDAGEKVAAEEIVAVAARPENRFMLFAALRGMNRSDLLPTVYSSSVAEGEAALAYWMMHPNELQDPPEVIELVETLRRHVNGVDANFHVYRYRMPAGHWAGDAWILGVAGPMPDQGEPYAEMPGAFSRVSDIEGKVKPSELVDWYVDMMKQKGMIQ